MASSRFIESLNRRSKDSSHADRGRLPCHLQSQIPQIFLILNTSNQNSTKNNKLNEYTLEEVAKHNTKSDAWIVIQGKVANVTKWIPKHPGGDIIMKGVGKDATRLFNSVGHDDYARKMLKKYQIGILKK